MVGHDAAVADFDDAAGIGGYVGVMRDQNDGVPVGVQLFQDRHHLGAAGLIQRTGGLVCQDHVAAIHQRARDRYALLLSTRKLPRPVAQSFAQAQPLQQVFGTGMPLHDRHAAINGRNFRVAHGAQVAHQMVALEDEAEMLAAQPRQLVWQHLAGFLAGHLVAAARGPVEAAQNVHQGRFPRSGRADDGYHFTGPDVQIDILEHGHHAISGGVFAYHATQAQQWQITTGRSCRRHLSVSVRTSVRQAYGCCQPWRRKRRRSRPVRPPAGLRALAPARGCSGRCALGALRWFLCLFLPWQHAPYKGGRGLANHWPMRLFVAAAGLPCRALRWLVPVPKPRQRRPKRLVHSLPMRRRQRLRCACWRCAGSGRPTE